jgi:hypothetical protein
MQGLDTPTPFLQLSVTIWKGQHDSLIGSEIIFTEEKGVYPPLTDAYCTYGLTPTANETDRSKKSVIPVTITEQRIRFNEVQLKPKSSESPSDLFIHEKSGPTADTSNIRPNIVDRITGKYVPEPTRAARGKGKGKKKGKQKAAVTELVKGADVEGISEIQETDERDVAMTEQGVPGDPDQGGPMDVAEG